MRLNVKTSGPKYVRIADKLREHIQRDFEPGSRFPTMSELRGQLGVSISTMERAYSLLEQEGVLVREQGRGTFIMKPTSKPQYVIAVSPRLMPDQHNPYWFNLLKGVNEGARAHHLEVIYSSHDYNSLWERADGMIVSQEILSDFGQPPADFPFVSLVGPVEGALCVAADDRSGIFQATEHLIDLGHGRIGVLFSHGPGSAIMDARYKGYRDALESATLPYRPELVRVESPRIDGALDKFPYVEAGYEGMARWLKAGFDCSAVVTYNDAMAVGAIQALKKAGLRVPEDVSVTGFDGTPAFDYFHPRLTTIHVPLLQIGRAGLDLLVRRLKGELGLPALTQLPVSLIVGESTAAPQKSASNHRAAHRAAGSAR